MKRPKSGAAPAGKVSVTRIPVWGWAHVARTTGRPSTVSTCTSYAPTGPKAFRRCSTCSTSPWCSKNNRIASAGIALADVLARRVARSPTAVPGVLAPESSQPEQPSFPFGYAGIKRGVVGTLILVAQGLGRVSSPAGEGVIVSPAHTAEGLRRVYVPRILARGRIDGATTSPQCLRAQGLKEVAGG